MRLLPTFGSVWSDRYRSAVPGAVASSYELVLRGSDAPGGRPGDGRAASWTISTRNRLFGSDENGRMAYGYPAPPSVADPYAVGLSSAAGPLLLPALDYYVDRGYVWFYVDPLTSAEVQAKLVPDGTRFSQACVWALHAPPDAPEPRPPGGTIEALTLAAATVYDSPRFEKDGVIECLILCTDGRWIITTSAEAFVLPAGAEPAANLTPGVAVHRCDPVGNAWRLVRLGLPVSEALTALGLEANPVGVVGRINWPNIVVPVTTDVVDGRTRSRFPLGGDAADLTALWDASHAQALAGRVSIAELLDTRTTPFGEPTPYDVARTVNPAEFLCGVLVAGAGYMVLTEPAGYGAAALPAAERKAALAEAAGTSCGVFEFEGGLAPLPIILP